MFTQIHINLAMLQRTEEWSSIHGDLKTLDYAVGMIQEDLGLLNKKNNCHWEEIDNVSSEQKTLFEIVGHLEAHVDELETIIDTQKHDITRLKRNVVTLDQNACHCHDHLLSPEPHGLSDEEGFEYSTDSEYQEALIEPLFCPCSDSPPPPTTPPSDVNEFTCCSLVVEGWATSFGCDITFNVIPDLEEEDVLLLLENMDPIPIIVGCGVFQVKPGEIDFIPFQVCGQHCKHSKGVPASTYHPYHNCSIKG